VFARFSVEFMASNLTLYSPEVTINVKDSMAKEFLEIVKITITFDIVGEVGDKEVLYIDKVGSADDMGEVEKVVDLENR
jgi:hypothetical protein